MPRGEWASPGSDRAAGGRGRLSGPSCSPFPLVLGGWGDLRLLGVFSLCLFAESLAVSHQRGLIGPGWGCLELRFAPDPAGPLVACLNHSSRSSTRKCASDPVAGFIPSRRGSWAVAAWIHQGQVWGRHWERSLPWGAAMGSRDLRRRQNLTNNHKNDPTKYYCC